LLPLEVDGRYLELKDGVKRVKTLLVVGNGSGVLLCVAGIQFVA
jgi:hypothetical protein